MLREKVTAYENEEEETEAQTNAMATNLKSVQNRLEEEKKTVGNYKLQLKEAKALHQHTKKTLKNTIQEKEQGTVKINELTLALDVSNKLCKERGEQVAVLKEETKVGQKHFKLANDTNAININMEQDLITVRKELMLSRKQTSTMEEKMEKKLKAMQTKWQASELRNEQMTEQVSSSTRPLLRQIAALQQLLEEQRSAWSTTENVLTHRAVRAETERVRSDEKSKIATHALEEAKHTNVRLEENVKLNKKELMQANELKHQALENIQVVQQEATTTKKEWVAVTAAHKELKNTLNILQIEINTLKKNNASALQLHANDKKEWNKKELIQKQREKEWKEGQRKLYQELQEKKTQQGNQSDQLNGNGGGGSGSTASGSTASLATLPNKEAKNSGSNYGEHSITNLVSSISRDNQVFNGIASIGITKMNGTRHIQAQNKFLETRCLDAEQARDVMATKLVAMGTELTKMQGLTSEMITLKSKHANIEKKQQILLEILGEKTEEVNDLTGDIQEMKRMYRQQTESLLEQIAAQAK